MRLSKWTVLVGLTCALAGCTHDTNGSLAPDSIAVTAVPSIDGAPPIESLQGLTLSIEAYNISPAELRQINNAQSTLISQCATRFGYTLALPPATGNAPSLLAQQYGVVDPKVAAEYGYHLPPGVGGTGKKTGAGSPPSKDMVLVLYGTTDPNPDLDATTPPGKTVDGVQIPAGGCYGEARRKLGVSEFDKLNADKLADQIRIRAAHQAEGDERVAAAMAKWSECMKGKGYSYTSLADMDSDAALKASISAPQPSSAEIQTAVADVACKRQANLIGVWYAVEVAYEKVAIQQNIERLTALRDAKDKLVRAAAQIAA